MRNPGDVLSLVHIITSPTDRDLYLQSEHIAKAYEAEVRASESICSGDT
jgi:hypothetical protein